MPELASYHCSYSGPQDSRPLAKTKDSVVVVQLGSTHGSGFVISDKGLVITNSHVVQNAGKVRILTPDGRKLDGRVLSRNPGRDVATIAVEDLRLPSLKIRKSAVNIGEEVYAVGTPQEIALSGTITKGIVSGIRQRQGQEWIQSDAAINHGNSGGPLLDARGNVVGISTAGIMNAQGLFFFVPITNALGALGIQ